MTRDAPLVLDVFVDERGDEERSQSVVPAGGGGDAQVQHHTQHRQRPVIVPERGPKSCHNTTYRMRPNERTSPN